MKTLIEILNQKKEKENIGLLPMNLWHCIRNEDILLLYFWTVPFYPVK
ncbi:MAG: hypothetical protein WBG58_16940 [Ignavibacteriaceae bacterium]